MVKVPTSRSSGCIKSKGPVATLGHDLVYAWNALLLFHCKSFSYSFFTFLVYLALFRRIT